MKNWLIAAVVALVVVAGCGSDGEDAIEESTSDVSEAIESGDADAAEEAIDDLAEAVEERQAAEGGGSASFTVGDQSYTFESVLCAFGPEEIGQEGAEFVLSSIQDGTQFYMSIDSFGHSVSLDDIEDFENPSVSWSSQGDGFIQLDGRSASGEADFLDGTTESFEGQPGSFEATCP
jgi:hypothetical protein